MKWFFSKIWAGLVAFVSWIVSLITAIFRGRTFVLPLEDSGIKQFSHSPEVIHCSPWLDRVERLTLRVKQGGYELIVALPYILAARHFQNLGAILFLRNGTNGVEYRAAAIEDIRIHNYRLHIVPLESTSTVSVLVTRGCARRNDGSATNVDHIELYLDGRRRTFFCDGISGFFYPTARRAVGF